MLIAPACQSLPLDLAAFVRLLRIEVRAGSDQTEVISLKSADPNGEDTLALEPAPCAPETSAMVATYSGRGAHRPFTRHIDLADVKRAERPRVMALVLAELLRDPPAGATPAPLAVSPPAAASSPALAVANSSAVPSSPAGAVPRTSPAPSSAALVVPKSSTALAVDPKVPAPPALLAAVVATTSPVPPAPSPASPPSAAIVRRDEPAVAEHREQTTPPPAGRWNARLAFDGRAFRSLDVLLLGGSIGAIRTAASLPLQLVADVALWRSRASQTVAATGTVDVTAAIFAAGADLTAHAGSLHLALGPRIEGGWGWLSGHPNDATVRGAHFNGPFAGAALTASASAPLTRSFHPFLELQAGLDLIELVGLADTLQATRLGGWWAAARVGLRIGAIGSP